MVVSSAIITMLASFILTIFNWRLNRIYVYLFGFIVPLNLFAITHHMLFYNPSTFWLALMYNNLAPIFYLPGPMLLFYVRGILDDRQSLRLRGWRDLLHFLPFLITLIGIAPYLFSSFVNKQEVIEELILNPNNFKDSKVNWLLPTWFNSILRPLLLLIYSIVSFRLVSDFARKSSLKTSFYQRHLVLRWLYSIIVVTSIVALCYLFMVIWYFFTDDARSIKSGMLVLSYFIGTLLMLIPAMLLIFPQLLYGLPDQRTKYRVMEFDQETKIDGAAIPETQQPLSFLQENLETFPKTDPFIDKAYQILEFVKDNHLYLDPEFSIESLVVKMNIPRNQIYYCLNNILGEKFTTIRTRLRVEYAKKLLLGEEAKRLSMDGIAKLAGFKSRTRFFVSFKEVVGLTPKEFLDKHK